MKTLLFTIDYPPFKGGVSNYYYNIVKNWPKKNSIFVLHNNENQLLKKWIYPQWIFSFYYLFKKYKQNQINHILVGHILPLGIITYYFSKIFKVKYTVILHGMDITYACKTKRKKNISTKILKKAENIICANSYTKQFVVENFIKLNHEKIKIVNPGINIDIEINQKILEKIKARYKKNNEVIIFSIGRLVKRKGFDKIIEIFYKIKKEFPNIKYLIAGAGEDKKYLQNLAKNEENIIFLNKITDEEKWAYLEMCDLFAMPSRNIDGDVEGFGIVYLEAGLLSKAVIAGDSGGVSDAVIHNKTGLLINPLNTNEIKNAIITLIKNKELKIKLGENSKKRIVDNFQWKDVVNKFYNAIK